MLTDSSRRHITVLINLKGDHRSLGIPDGSRPSSIPASIYIPDNSRSIAACEMWRLKSCVPSHTTIYIDCTARVPNSFAQKAKITLHNIFGHSLPKVLSCSNLDNDKYFRLRNPSIVNLAGVTLPTDRFQKLWQILRRFSARANQAEKAQWP